MKRKRNLIIPIVLCGIAVAALISTFAVIAPVKSLKSVKSVKLLAPVTYKADDIPELGFGEGDIQTNAYRIILDFLEDYTEENSPFSSVTIQIGILPNEPAKIRVIVIYKEVLAHGNCREGYILCGVRPDYIKINGSHARNSVYIYDRGDSLPKQILINFYGQSDLLWNYSACPTTVNVYHCGSDYTDLNLGRGNDSVLFKKDPNALANEIVYAGTVYGGDGNDWISSWSSSDPGGVRNLVASGEGGDDFLYGSDNEYTDILYGGPGNDVIDGHGGPDLIQQL